ncbi:MAG TPA: YXWGXW repeat-containing protein [Rhodanobacteraceae bacterium]|nr:YXWGXW repeat-containing protein [Rhodanobacteraceae bacterium]
MKRIATMFLVAGLLGSPVLAFPPAASAGVSIGIGVSVGVPPPVLPVYAQPLAPGPGYIWTPGYWAWDPAYGDYYWVPGAWVLPPEIGLLWTPGWWGWSAGYYRWHPGYWGQHVGFYGGINYGFGYFGVGYVGGYWRGRHFYYNRAVNNINVTRVRNVYVDRTVIKNVHRSRVSYHGGHGGIMARPGAEQRASAGQRHFSPTPRQAQQREAAMHHPVRRFSNNRRQPAAFPTRPGQRVERPHGVRESSGAYGRAMNPPNRAFKDAPRPTDRSYRRAGYVTQPGHRGDAKAHKHQSNRGGKHHKQHDNGQHH